MNTSVYLAGPISGQTLAGANNWRTIAQEYLSNKGIKAITPLRGKDYLNSLVEADGTYKTQYSEHPMSTPHGITCRDRWDSTRCDLLFAYFPDGLDKVSIGTIMEIAWASMSGVYVLAVIEKDSIHDHGMLTESCSLVLHDFDQALKLIPVILGV